MSVRASALEGRVNEILEHRTRWSDARAVCLDPLSDFRLSPDLRFRDLTASNRTGDRSNDTCQQIDRTTMATHAWYDPQTPAGLERHGNPNVLTLDKGTSRLAQGPSAHTTLVELEPVDGPIRR